MRDLSHDRTFNKDNVNASNYLLGSEIAVPVALFGIGVFKGNAHARETGILSGEALADAVVVGEVSKIILRRERPLVNNAAGDFSPLTWGRAALSRRHIARWRGPWRQSWLENIRQSGCKRRLHSRDRSKPDAGPRPGAFSHRRVGGRCCRIADRALRV
jgi:hypothetical protein